MTEVEGRFSRVLTELAMRGWGARKLVPEMFLSALQIDLGWYVAFWLLAVAGAAASSVTIERERDTWVSLTATPLTGREIFRGKVLGAIWHQRGFAAVLISVWMLGLITGAVHPAGVMLSFVAVAALTWLVATLGVHASIRARDTSRAMASTLLPLAFLNGYPIIVFLWFLQSIGWSSSYTLLGAMPSISAWAMISPEQFSACWTVATTGSLPARAWWIIGGIGLGILFIYVGTAIALTWRILRHFDHWLDRPPLSASPAIARVPARPPEEVAVT